MAATLKELYELVHENDHKSLWIVFVLTLLMAVTEAVGVATILPFIGVATEPQVINENRFLTYLYELFNFETLDSFVFALGVSCLVLLVGSIVLRGIALWAQLRFSHYQISSISARLVAGYLRQPYEWFLTRNSSELGAKVLNEVGNVVHGALYPAMIAIANALVAVCLLTVLVAVDPILAAIGSLVLGISYFLIFVVVKRMLARIGHERVEANKQRYRVVQEAFRGIKAVKISSLENHFYGLFRVPALRMASRSVTAALVSELPSLLMQAMVFGGMLSVLLYLLSAYDDLGSALPYLALYSLAGYRLLPSLQGIYKSLSQIRFNSPAVSELLLDIQQAENAELAGKQAAGNPDTGVLAGFLRTGIELKAVSYRYPESAANALDNISFSIWKNTSVGIVGTTGSGKTTLVDVILGLLQPSSGTIEIDGHVLNLENRRSWQRKIGYVPQHIHLVDASIAANIAFGVPDEKIDLDRVILAARAARIHEFISNELPDGYQTPSGENGVRLSGGQRQRIGIARALYHDPEVVVLDEATSALDTVTEQATMESIKSLGHEKTILIIAHRLSTIRHCDQLIVLNKGIIEACGSFDDLLRDNPRFRDMVEGS